MFKSRRGGLLAAVCSAGLVLGLAVPAAAETLADAIALAYQTNPTLQAQRASQRALDESIVQARSGWRPTLSASTASELSVNHSSSSSTPSASANFEMYTR